MSIHNFTLVSLYLLETAYGTKTPKNVDSSPKEALQHMPSLRSFKNLINFKGIFPVSTLHSLRNSSAPHTSNQFYFHIIFIFLPFPP